MIRLVKEVPQEVESLCKNAQVAFEFQEVKEDEIEEEFIQPRKKLLDTFKELNKGSIFLTEDEIIIFDEKKSFGMGIEYGSIMLHAVLPGEEAAVLCQVDAQKFMLNENESAMILADPEGEDDDICYFEFRIIPESLEMAQTIHNLLLLVDQEAEYDGASGEEGLEGDEEDEEDFVGDEDDEEVSGDEEEEEDDEEEEVYSGEEEEEDPKRARFDSEGEEEDQE